MTKRVMFSGMFFCLFLCLVCLSIVPFFLIVPEQHSISNIVGTNPDEHKFDNETLKNTAFILEGRFLPNKMSFVIRNAQKVLGPSWIVMIASSGDTINKLKKVLQQDHTIDSSSIEYITLKHNITNSWDYNNIVKDISLWKHFKGEFVLFFQTDSILCSRSSYKVEDFFVFDYIGGYTPDHENYITRCKEIPKCYSNGGLSLRRISSAMQVFDLMPPGPFTPAGWGMQKNPERWDEDMYFYEGISRLSGAMPDQNFDLAKHFSFNTWKGSTSITFGGHKVPNSRATREFREHCPEYGELEKTVDKDI